MVAAVASFAIMDSSLKGLSAHYTPLQVSCIRCLSSLLCISPLLLWRRSRAQLRMAGIKSAPTARCTRHRNARELVYGVRHLTISQTYSLYLTAPLLMTALSVPLFHEHVTPRRWLAILVGLAGVLVILSPWRAGAFALLPAAAVLLATLCYSLSALMVRSLSRSNSRLSLVYWYLLLVGVGSGLLAGRDWLPLQSQDWRLLAGVGIAGTLGQLWITEAFSCAPPSVVGTATALLWAFLIDRIVWSASPSRNLVLGALVVVGSGIFIIEDERRMGVDTPP